MSKTRVLSSNPNQNSRTPQKKGGGIFGFFKTLFKIGVFLFIIGVIGILGFYFAVRQGFFGKLPTAQELKAIKNPNASEIYDIDGELLGKYYIENRTNVAYKQISTHVIKALVATEDARFFDHKGVDSRSLMRVLFKTLLMGDSSAGGGSTISQQLIKNLYGRDRHGKLTMPVNKIKESIIASRLEKVYDKQEVIALYLNTVAFGERAYGIGTAAQRFFSKHPKDLEPQEAAVLVGMLKATTYYNPRLHPKRSLTRRNTVLNQMVKKGYLTDAQATTLKAKPLGLNYKRISQSDGLAPHLRDKIKAQVKQWAKDNPKSDGTNYNVFTDGLKVYTTIDKKMQQYAQASVNEHMKSLQKDFYKHWEGRYPWGTDQDIITNAKKRSTRYKRLKAAGKSQAEIDRIFRKPVNMTIFDWTAENFEKQTKLPPLDSLRHYLKFLNTGFMVMDPENGHVKASIGSINYKYFRFDHTNGRRQVGSTFKPIVYATALNNKVAQPCDYFPNELRNYVDYQDWTPRNSDNKYGGFYSMKGGLTKSVNTISVQIILQTGIDKVIELAKNMGIGTKIPSVPSIALGTAELPLSEMVGSYCSFVNGGRQTKPQYIAKIENNNSRILATSKTFNGEPNPKKRKKILEEKTAQAMIEMLESVVDSGTGGRLRRVYNLEGEMGGKTGTTQKQTDGWFMGVTPRLVGGVWVGGQDRRVRFRSIGLGQGANMALPIWGRFLQKVYSDNSYKRIANARFKRVPNDLVAQLDCPIFVDELITIVGDPNQPLTEQAIFDENGNLVLEGEEDLDEEIISIEPPPPPTNTEPEPVKRNFPWLIGSKKDTEKEKEEETASTNTIRNKPLPPVRNKPIPPPRSTKKGVKGKVKISGKNRDSGTFTSTKKAPTRSTPTKANPPVAKPQPDRSNRTVEAKPTAPIVTTPTVEKAPKKRRSVRIIRSTKTPEGRGGSIQKQPTKATRETVSSSSTQPKKIKGKIAPKRSTDDRRKGGGFFKRLFKGGGGN